MVDTSPPIWYLDIVRPQGPARISLSTEELQSPVLFQRRCMESIQQMPPTMKMDEWQPIVSALMQHCSKIEVPPEMSPTGQFLEHLWDFLQNRATDGSYEDLLRGVPYKDATHFYFRMRDLSKHLDQVRFTAIKQNEILAILKGTLKADKGFKNLGGRGVHYWKLAAPAAQADVDPTLPAPGFKQPY